MIGHIGKDKISGFEGIIVSKIVWLYGCVRLQLRPIKLKDGKVQEDQYFDEPQVKVGDRKFIPLHPHSHSSHTPVGWRMKDRLSGFKGIVYGVQYKLFERPTVCLSPEKLIKAPSTSDNVVWLPLDQLELVSMETPFVPKQTETVTVTGGPRRSESAPKMRMERRL